MNQSGFTLAELLVVVAVLGLILAGILGIQQQGQLAYLVGSNRVEAQQNARVAITLMGRELRAACAVAALSATSVQYTMVEPSRAGSVDCSSPVAGDIVAVRYALSGSILYRDQVVPPTALPALGSGTALIGGVAGLTFTGYDSANATTSTPGAACAAGVVCSIAIAIRTKSEAPAASFRTGNVWTSLDTRVRLRNI